VECLFLIDNANTLYCFPLRVGQKRFRAIDDAEMGAFVGCVCPAKDGIFYWNYISNEVRSLTTDIFDPVPRYFNWSVLPENPGGFVTMNNDMENFIMFVLWDSVKEEVVIEIRDIKDGTYINQVTLDKNSSVLGFQAPGLAACVIDGETVHIQLGAQRPPDREAVRQLLNLSGRTLDEDQHVTASVELVRLDCFENWPGYLVWSRDQWRTGKENDIESEVLCR